MIDIDSLTQLERQSLLSKLLSTSVGPMKFEGENVYFLPFHVPSVKPGERVPVGAACYLNFKPKRFVVQETVVQTIATKITTEPPKSFWDRLLRKGSKITREDKIETVAVPRSSWLLNSMHIGAAVQFGSYASINCDAFGPTNEMDFDGTTANPGLSVSLYITNVGKIESPFFGILLGEVVEAKTPEMPRIRRVPV